MSNNVISIVFSKVILAVFRNYINVEHVSPFYHTYHHHFHFDPISSFLFLLVLSCHTAGGCCINN